MIHDEFIQQVQATTSMSIEQHALPSDLSIHYSSFSKAFMPFVSNKREKYLIGA